MTGAPVSGRVVMARIGGPGWDFNAAHAGIHAGRFEPLHGHTYQVQVTVWGVPDRSGMVADFGVLKEQLRIVLAPLKHRTLIAGQCEETAVTEAGGQVQVVGAGASFSLPREWVTLLPVASTSTEALAAYLADGLAARFSDTCARVERVEVTLTESAECAAVAEAVIA